MHTPRYALVAVILFGAAAPEAQQKYVDAAARVRVALAKQPLSPNGPSKGPATMAEGGIQKIADAVRGVTARAR